VETCGLLMSPESATLRSHRRSLPRILPSPSENASDAGGKEGGSGGKGGVRSAAPGQPVGAFG